MESPSSWTDLEKSPSHEREWFALIDEFERKGSITEEDLDQLWRHINHRKLTQEDLGTAMRTIGGLLQARPDPWLQELGTSVYQAASARISREHQLHHSLPDEGTTTVVVDTAQKAFHHSLIIENDEEKDDEKDTTSLPAENGPTTETSDLDHSGIFEWDKTEHILISPFQDPRLATLKNLQEGVFTEEDERIRSAKTLTLVDIRRKLGSSIGEKARAIREHSIDENSQLHLSVLEAIHEIKDLINRLLQSTYHELHIRWNVGQARMHQRFFQENEEHITSLLKVDKTISELEADAEEIKQLLFEKEFLLEMMAEVSEDFEAWREREKKETLPSIFTESLRNHVFARIKSILDHEAEIQQRLSALQTQFRELFQNIWKLKIQIPDPWDK
ncbi:MAG: hypothetical protein AB7J40_04155 [Candidatus Altimarinota bacterium]